MNTDWLSVEENCRTFKGSYGALVFVNVLEEIGMAYYDEFGKYGDKAAVIDDENNRITYSDLERFCRQAGDKMSHRTLVFSFCENSIGSICAYVSCLYNHVVPVLLDKHIEKELRNNLLEIYKPEYVYIPQDLYGEFEEAEIVLEQRGYRLCRTGYSLEHEMYEELGLLLTTSGSTGSPKLVRQSYTNIQENAKSIAEYLKIDETERPITTLPMNYTYGLSTYKQPSFKRCSYFSDTAYFNGKGNFGSSLGKAKQLRLAEFHIHMKY